MHEMRAAGGPGRFLLRLLRRPRCGTGRARRWRHRPRAQSGGRPAGRPSPGPRRHSSKSPRRRHSRVSGRRCSASPIEETILKTYETVQLRTGLFKRKRGQGTLYVTSARVVFYAWVNPRATQRASWLLQQTKLEDISGLSVNVSRRLSPGLLMLSLLFGLAALGTLLTVVLIPLTVIFVILTVISLVFLIRDAASRGSIGMSIHSRENGHSPINVGHSGRIGSVGLLWRALPVAGPDLLSFLQRLRRSLRRPGGRRGPAGP